ncbi:zonular occludens toxin domain-containing protein, partial [Kingella kingae]|uniref:zonular occludens toxin domain-containing protein n=1 Tax=Kingella kingae TaxID=504 RepID=UPI001E514C43
AFTSFFLTQHPRLIDINLRSLIGEHRNISRTMIGLNGLSYWQKCANPESKNDVADAKNSIFKTKTAAFGMYKSSEVHNQVNGVLSSWIWFFPLVLCIIGYLSLHIHSRFEQGMQPQKTPSC